MKSYKNFLSAATLAFLTSTLAQNVTVPTTCMGNLTAGTDEVLFTVPYTYSEVMSIIGSYQNLTWSGNPPNTVKLNGSDNTVGTARTYNLAGAHVIETILNYSKPAGGPYYEVHNTALLSVGPIQLYIPYDGTTVTTYCGGKASQFNFTAHFCSNNVTAAGATLHMLHLGDAMTVGKFLGGKNFTNCAALGEKGASAPPTAASTSMGAGATSGAGGGSQGMGSSSSSAGAAMYTAAVGVGAAVFGAAMLVI